MMEVTITHPRIYWLLKPLRHLLDRARIFYFFREENKKDKPAKYPAQFTNVQAFIGLMQLEKIKNNRIHRIGLCGCPILRLPVKEWQKGMERYFVRGRWFDSPIFGCKDFELAGYRWESCPNAERACKQIGNLPVHPRVRKEHFEMDNLRIRKV
jgi:dTDP-4-amino-4,6-dideoxygalactose transaminase